MPEEPKHTPSYHNSKWYKNHPDAVRPVPSSSMPVPENKPVVPVPIWLLRSLGVGVCLGGIAIMQFYFIFGVALVCAGVGALIWEICKDPFLCVRPIWIQIGGIAVVLIVFAMNRTAVILNPTSTCDLTQIGGKVFMVTHVKKSGGIAWDSHFTDLRVTVTNPSNDDYQTGIDLIYAAFVSSLYSRFSE